MLGLLLPARVFAGDLQCVGAVINTYSEATQDAEKTRQFTLQKDTQRA